MGETTGEPEVQSERPEAPSGIRTGDYVRVIVTMMIMFGILFVIYLFVKKKLNIQSDTPNGGTVISSQTIGAGKWIQIVYIAGKYFILGVTNDNINLIKEIDSPAEIERLEVLHNSKAAASGSNFVDIIGDFFNRKNHKSQTTQQKFDYETDSVSFLQEQKKRLKDMDDSNGT